MKVVKDIINRLWDKLLVIFGALTVLLPVSPLNMPSPQRDSGVFLYIGWRILNGELPYRDIWDHKPPVIFYLNALGLAITDNSRWGVWTLELISLSLAAFIGFQLIKKAFGTPSAVFSLLLLFPGLTFIIQGGNFTTEYTLPLQFAALWLVYDVEEFNFSYRRWYLIGLLGGIAFLTKQTAIGVWIAIGLYLTISRLRSGQVKKWARELLSITLGILTICIAWALFFGMQGSLTQFWDAAFTYNLSYSSSTMNTITKLTLSALGLKTLATVGLAQFSILGYITGGILLVWKKNIKEKSRPLLIIGLINLPVELILISISGRYYPHYYMTILPALSLFSGVAIWGILFPLSYKKLPEITKYFFIVIIVGFLLWSTVPQFKEQIIINQQRSAQDAVEIKQIKSITGTGDYVLLWGAETATNFSTQRKSPTRYAYQYPLYTPGYVNEQMILTFLDDLIQNPPAFIIDTHNPVTPIYEFPIRTTAITKKINYLQDHYCLASPIDNWTTYQYTEQKCAP